MQKKITSIIFIIITLILIIGSININQSTVSYAKDRIITKINNTPITLEETSNTALETEVPEFTENQEAAIEEQTIEESNSYTQVELIIIILTSIIVIVCLLNLIITKFGTISFKEALGTSKRLIYYSLILVTLSTASALYSVISTDNRVLNGPGTKGRDEKSIAIIEITENDKTNSLKEESKTADTSVIQVSNTATYKASNLELLKLSGATSDKESSLYYGLNSALLIKDGSTIELSNSKISTGVDYAAAIFASSFNTNVNLTNTTLVTKKSNSSGITSSSSANVTANDIKILTTSDNSPAINTLTSDSKITIQDSEINTKGFNSPIINNKGKVNATNINGTTLNSNIITMNSINDLVVTSSNLTTELQSPKGNLSLIDIYTEMNKTDRLNYSNASVTIEDSFLDISPSSPFYKEALLFNVTNVDVNINLSNTQINYGSDILFKITGNNKYGELNNNGGNVIFTATDQQLQGKVIVDELSSISLNLNNTYYKGQINSENTSKSVDIVLDKTTEWELTGDSYIRTLTIQNGKISRLKKQINSNGYDIYYNAYQNDWLEGQTIILTGGGKLIPVYES